MMEKWHLDGQIGKNHFSTGWESTIKAAWPETPFLFNALVKLAPIKPNKNVSKCAEIVQLPLDSSGTAPAHV